MPIFQHLEEITNLKDREVARIGFLTIHNAIRSGDTPLALDIALALHHFPDHAGNTVQAELTRDSIKELSLKYPENKDIAELLLASDPDNIIGYEMFLDLKIMADECYHSQSETH